MIISKDVEIPDTCPENCTNIGGPFYQGDICFRCPIFNCTPNNEGDCLVDPEDYRKDWAIEFQRWFKNGAKGVIILPI